jgi:hypothetical protein
MRKPTMTRAELIAGLKAHGEGWHKFIGDGIALQDKKDALIDETIEQMSAKELRTWHRKTDAHWRKNKGQIDRRITHALVSTIEAIKILEARK